MPRHVFMPIANAAKYRYILTSDHGATHDRFAINRHFRYYETLGDGSTAHTPDMPVPVEMLPDYLQSLAKAMLESKEITEGASYEIRPFLEDNVIAFCESVRYKEGKTRYYSVREQKVSASDSKRHDKRYEEVREWCDGSVDAVVRMNYQDFGSTWSHYVRLEKIKKWYSDHDLLRGQKINEVDWRLSDDDRQHLNRGYAACLMIVEAFQLTSWAQRIVKGYESVLEYAKEKAEA